LNVKILILQRNIEINIQCYIENRVEILILQHNIEKNENINHITTKINDNIKKMNTNAQLNEYPKYFISTINTIGNFTIWIRNMNPIVLFCSRIHIIDAINNLKKNSQSEKNNMIKTGILIKILETAITHKLKSFSDTMKNEMKILDFDQAMPIASWQDEIVQIFYDYVTKQLTLKQPLTHFCQMFNVNMYNGRSFARVLYNSKNFDDDHKNGHEKPIETIFKILITQ